MYVSLPIDIQLPSPADIFAFVVIIDPFLDTFWTPSAHLQSHFKACTCASKRHPVAKSFEHHRTVFNHWPRGLHIAPTIQARTCTHQITSVSKCVVYFSQVALFVSQTAGASSAPLLRSLGVNSRTCKLQLSSDFVPNFFGACDYPDVYTKVVILFFPRAIWFTL